jgi:hypothetical protein
VKLCTLTPKIWRTLHNEELRDFYSSPSIIRIIKSRKMRWARHIVRMGRGGEGGGRGREEERVKVIGGKASGKDQGRPRHRSVDYIWMNLGEVGWVDAD